MGMGTFDNLISMLNNAKTKPSILIAEAGNSVDVQVVMKLYGCKLQLKNQLH